MVRWLEETFAHREAPPSTPQSITQHPCLWVSFHLKLPTQQPGFKCTLLKGHFTQITKKNPFNCMTNIRDRADSYLTFNCLWSYWCFTDILKQIKACVHIVQLSFWVVLNKRKSHMTACSCVEKKKKKKYCTMPFLWALCLVLRLLEALWSLIISIVFWRQTLRSSVYFCLSLFFIFQAMNSVLQRA